MRWTRHFGISTEFLGIIGRIRVRQTVAAHPNCRHTRTYSYYTCTCALYVWTCSFKGFILHITHWIIFFSPTRTEFLPTLALRLNTPELTVTGQSTTCVVIAMLKISCAYTMRKSAQTFIQQCNNNNNNNNNGNHNNSIFSQPLLLKLHLFTKNQFNQIN